MNRMDNNATSRGLTEFFRANSSGGNVRWTPGVNPDALRVYGEVAREAIEHGKDTQGVQAERLELIERALGGQ